MVQTPLLRVKRQGLGTVLLTQHLGHFLCGLRKTWSRVLLLKQRLRETAKIMNRFGLDYGSQPPTLCEPVRGNTQNELRLGPLYAKLGAQGLPATAVHVVFDRVHGTAMPQKDHWHAWGLAQGA